MPKEKKDSKETILLRAHIRSLTKEHEELLDRYIDLKRKYDAITAERDLSGLIFKLKKEIDDRAVQNLGLLKELWMAKDVEMKLREQIERQTDIIHEYDIKEAKKATDSGEKGSGSGAGLRGNVA